MCVLEQDISMTLLQPIQLFNEYLVFTGGMLGGRLDPHV